MRESTSALILVLLVNLWNAGAAAQQPSSPDAVAEQLIAQERMRVAVEQALALYRGPAESGEEKNDNFVQAGDDLVRVGAGVVPFLAAELEQALPESFFFCAYALGRLGTPEAESALRQAIERTEREVGDYALTRKSWAVYGLGLMRVGDALELLYRGRHRTGGLPIHHNMTVTEAVALQTPAESLPILLELVDRFAGDPDQRAERTIALRALWRLSAPASVPKLIEVAKDEDRHMRQEAVRALAYIPTPEALSAALAALDDPEATVRRLAAVSLLRAQTEFEPGVVIRRLEVEDEPRVLEPLYGLLVALTGTAVIDRFEQRWDSASPLDRVAMLAALERVPVPATLPLLRKGLHDPDNTVVTRAVLNLGAVGTDDAVKLLRLAVHSPTWGVARAAVEQLVALHKTAAAEAVADRLLNVELYRPVRDVEYRYRPEQLADALVRLEYPKALAGLKKATARQIDPVLIESLQRSISQLEALKANTDDEQRWIEASRSDRPEVRLVAYRRLAELGGDGALETLVGAFGRVEPEEGVEILRVLAGRSEAPALSLLERVLTGPEFDHVERLALRDMAAWSARRTGGERMFEALRAAVERRDGRDAKVLVYLLALGGERALPVLERYWLARMHYLKWTRAKELEVLDEIRRSIGAGRSIAEYDVAPEVLLFR